MSYTKTASGTTTATEARVRDVMQKVGANFTGIVVRGLVTEERADEWTEVVTHLLINGALDGFQVQFAMKSRAPYCIHYAVSDDGSIQQDSPSGALDLYSIPAGTPVSFCLDLREEKAARARAWLDERGGWGHNGRMLAGDDSEARSFSSGGFGVARSKRGAWAP